MALKARCCWCGGDFHEIVVAGLTAKVCTSKLCEKRQLDAAIGGRLKGEHKTKCWYVPLPRQVEAIEAVESGKFRWILFGGALGGSKSHFLRWLAYKRCLNIPNYRALLLRRTYPELEKTHMREAVIECPQMAAKPLLSAKPPVVEFIRGSILEFGHCQDDKNVSSYLSAEYDLIIFDELVTFEERMVAMIASRARTTKKNVQPMIVCGTNPGGIGALWVKDRWIDKSVDKVRYPGYKPEQYAYIPSLLDDNPYINPDYEDFLDALDPEVREAYRWGRWDIFEGQFFKEFRREKHVQRLEVPLDLPRIGGMDWGYASPGVHLWAVVLPDGHLHITHELKFKETVATEVAQQIVSLNRQHGLTLSTTYADPSMWIRTGQTGESIAETLQRGGVPVQRAHHERVNGWQRVRHWLRDAPDGLPWLTFDPDCLYLLRTLPSLCHDKTHVEDVDTNGEDHAADALRYLVMSRPALPTKAMPSLPPDCCGAMMRELVNAANSDRLGTDNVQYR